MKLQRALKYKDKIDELIKETTEHFAPAYFVKNTKTAQKSELNKLIKDANFEDVISDESHPEYGQYSIVGLTKCLNLLWTEKCQLLTGISLAKNTLKLADDDTNSYCYDAMLAYNEDRKAFLNPDNIYLEKSFLSIRNITDKEIVTYMGNPVSYPVVNNLEIDKKQIELLKQIKKEIIYSTDVLSSDLENALYKIEVDDDYAPTIPFSITFEDLYSEIDLILKEKSDRISSAQTQSRENITVSAEDLESEMN